MPEIIKSESDFINLIEKSLDYKCDQIDILNTFLSNSRDVIRYVIGKNTDTLNLSKIIKIDAIIDDYSDAKFWNEIPILKFSNIDLNAIFVNCSTSISPIEVSKKLNNIGVSNVIHLSDIIFSNKVNFTLPVFVQEMRSEWKINKSRWFNLYLKLNDEFSKNVLIDLISFRLSSNLTYMKNYNVRLQDQYFENFMNYNSETYVDVGGYDGDTTELFCLNDQNYKKVFIFEPSKINMETAKKRLANFNNIKFYSFGVSNKKEELFFNENEGSSSSISETGLNKITTTTLDEEIKEKISVIKMDIEGWELNALKGSINHIVNDNPKMAITVYHNAKDFIEIPEYILSLNANYKLYLRHYTSGWSETVMYFVPV